MVWKRELHFDDPLKASHSIDSIDCPDFHSQVNILEGHPGGYCHHLDVIVHQTDSQRLRPQLLRPPLALHAGGGDEMVLLLIQAVLFYLVFSDIVLWSLILSPFPAVLTRRRWDWPSSRWLCGCWRSPAGLVTVLAADSGRGWTSATCTVSGEPGLLVPLIFPCIVQARPCVLIYFIPPPGTFW